MSGEAKAQSNAVAEVRVKPGPPRASRDVWLWDVFETHLDEADFGMMLFEQRLESATASLADVERFPESALRAHVDGLVAGGDEVQARMILPVLENPDPEEPFRATAVALAAIEHGNLRALEPALSAADRVTREAVVRASQLATNPGLEAWVRDRLERSPAPFFRCGLLRVAAVRGFVVPDLSRALASDDPALLEAAAGAAAHAEAAQYSAALERLVDHSHPRVHAAATLAALRWRSRKAWVACERAALEGGDRTLAALYAALGGRRHHQRLLDCLHTTQARGAVLYALGFSGNAAVLPALREQLRAPEAFEAKLAAQSIALIAGIDVLDESYALALTAADEEAEAEAALPEFERDDLDADLVPEPEADLPAPNVRAIERDLDRLRLDDTKRLLGGRLFGPLTCIEYLERSPLRRHHVLAAALEIATAGAVRFDSRAFASVQLRALRNLRDSRLAQLENELRAIHPF